VLIWDAKVTPGKVAPENLEPRPVGPPLVAKPERYVKIKRSSLVTAIAISPNEEWMAVGGAVEGLSLLDTRSGSVIRTLPDSSGARAVSFSPDGSMVAGTVGRKLVAWETRTGKVRWHQNDAADGVNALTYSPDGATLVGTDDARGRIILWDARAGKLARTALEDGILTSIACSPDGKQVAAGIDSTSRWADVSIWDGRITARRKTLEGHSSRISGIAYSPDGRLLASCSRDKSIRIWDTGNWTLRTLLRGHQAGVTSVVFRPDSRTLISVDSQGSAKVWDVQRGLRQSWDLGRSPTGRLALSRSGHLLALGLRAANNGSAGELRIWKLQ
jgi:WD40 repeat protein